MGLNPDCMKELLQLNKINNPIKKKKGVGGKRFKYILQQRRYMGGKPHNV